MGGCHLQASRTKVHRHVVVLDDWDRAVDKRDDCSLSLKVFVAFVGRVHTDGGICHDGLRSHRRNGYKVGRSLNRIADMVQLRWYVAVKHFIVREGSLSDGIPVYHAQTPIDEPLVV